MDTLIDPEETTESIRKFLRKWIPANLPLITGPQTKPSELKLVQSIPNQITFDDGAIYFDDDETENLFNELQYGSTRWPKLQIEDMIDAHLLAEADKCFED